MKLTQVLTFMAIDSALNTDESQPIHVLHKTLNISEILPKADQHVRSGVCGGPIDGSEPSTFLIRTDFFPAGSITQMTLATGLGRAVEVRLDVRLKMIASPIPESEFVLTDYPNGGV